MIKYIGVGECAVSVVPGEVLKTLALGSCVAVVAVSRKIPVAGLLHVQLPESMINPALSREKPGTFADTGVAVLLEDLYHQGCNSKDIVIKLIGGAQVLDPNNVFSIGKRNYLAIKKWLWAKRLWPLAEDVGGTKSRSVTVTVGDEKIVISSPGAEDWSI